MIEMAAEAFVNTTLDPFTKEGFLYGGFSYKKDKL